MLCYDFKRKELRKVKILFGKLSLFIFSFAFAGNVYAAGLQQTFTVQIGVFDAATAGITYETEKGGFNIAAEVATANLFNTLYPFKALYQSRGLLLRDEIVPEIYQAKTLSRSHQRIKKILYDQKGQAYKRVSIKDMKEKTAIIQNILPHADAADLQTVFAMVIHHFRQQKRCAMAREIYDGKKHYKVIVSDKGAGKHYSVLSDKYELAYQCDIYVQNLKNNNDNILWDISAERPIHIWLGWNPTVKMPYFLEIGIDSTPLGALKITPRSLKIW